MPPRPVAIAAAIALLGFAIGTTQAFAGEGEPAPADKAAPVDKAVPADKGTPAALPPAPDAKPAANKDAVIADCGKALDKLAAGDAKALDSLDEQSRQALMTHKAAANTVTCLAVAEKNEKFCELLPKEQQEGCAHQFKMAGSLKGASKDDFKARTIFEACSQGGNVPPCQMIRDAIVSHDAGKCNGLPPVNVPFCAALATSDAAKCKAITDEADQATCAAYASNDAKRCPKEGDCRNVVSAFSIVAEKGVAGLGDIDPTLVAAVEGRKACAAGTAELKKDCGGH